MAHEHPTILLIEDHDDARESLAELLRFEGYSVICARNGRDAFNKLYQGARPCIILLDLAMPEMSGFEFRQEQRKHGEFKDVPVIVYSSLNDLEAIAGHLDAKAYLQKPSELARLLALVEEHCLK
jgi:CheY-like chemotaxis protein